MGSVVLPFNAAMSFLDEAEPLALAPLELESFLKLDLPKRSFILDPIIPFQGLVLVYSRRGVGKTFLGLGIAHAVATGGSFLRFRAPEARHVLYIDGEMPAVTLRERLWSIMAGRRVEPGFMQFILADLHPESLPDISTHAGQGRLESAMQGTELLIIDNLSTLCRSGDENTSESWLPVQEWALSLRKRGVAVLFIHHAGKTGQQRGTSRREDVLDTVISLRHPEDYSPTDGARFELHIEKGRGIVGDSAQPFEARLEIVDDVAHWLIHNVESDRLRRWRAREWDPLE